MKVVYDVKNTRKKWGDGTTSCMHAHGFVKTIRVVGKNSFVHITLQHVDVQTWERGQIWDGLTEE